VPTVNISAMSGTVEAIHLVATNGGPPAPATDVRCEPGRGLEGDRYWDDAEAGDITLIELEALERLQDDAGIDLRDGTHRRNVTVRGVDLGELVGRRFRVGEVECVGEERCEPCAHLARLTAFEVLRGLVHTGLRADVARGGTIRVGDRIELL
jgi:MOSC domain-containing protein YiiM